LTSPQQPYGAANTPPNYLAWSILNMIFCCLPFGIVGLVYAIQANSAADAVTAYDASTKAKAWNLAATIIGAVVGVIVLIVVAGAHSPSS